MSYTDVREKYSEKFAWFEKHEVEFCNFDKVQNKRSRHADLHAFLLLEELAQGDQHDHDIIAAAEHDEIWLSIEPASVMDKMTEEQAIELIRCGVLLDDDNFHMFV